MIKGELTKGELIKELEKYPDDMQITIYCADAGGYTSFIKVTENIRMGKNVIELEC